MRLLTLLLTQYAVSVSHIIVCVLLLEIFRPNLKHDVRVMFIQVM